MVGVEDYNSLNRKEKELLGKGFNYSFPFTCSFSFESNEACFRAKASELYPLAAFTTLTKVLMSKATGWQTVTYKHPECSTELKCRPDGKFQISLDCPQEYLQVARFIFKSNNFFQLSSEVIHTHPNAIASLRFDTFLNLRARASVGIPEMGAGFKSKFNIQLLSFRRYELASWWCKKPRKMVAKQIYTGKSPSMIFDEFVLSYYDKLSSKSHLAASARYNLANNDYFVEVGIKHHIDEVKSFKAKVNSYGQISLMQSHIHSPFEDINIRFEISSSAQVNLLDLSSDNCKLGFRLDFKAKDD